MSREPLLKQADPDYKPRNTDPPVVSLGVSERQPPPLSLDLDSLKISTYLNPSDPSQASSSTNQPQNVPLSRSKSLFEIRRKPLPFRVKPEAILQKLGLKSHSKDTETGEGGLDMSVIDKSEELPIRKSSGPRPVKLVESNLNGGRLSTIQELTTSPSAPTRAPPLIPEQVSPPEINLGSRSLPDTAKPDIHLLGLNYERPHPISSFEGRALGSSLMPSVGQRRLSEWPLTSTAIRDLATNASSSSMVPGNSFVASTTAVSSVPLVDIDAHKTPSITVAATAATTMPSHSRPAGPRAPPSEEPAVTWPRQQHHRNENRQNLRQHGMRQRGMVDLDGYVALSREEAEWYRVICRRILHEDTGARSRNHILTGRPNRPRDGSEYGSIDGAVGRNRGGTTLRGRVRGGRGWGGR